MFSREELLHRYPSRYEDLRDYERGLVTAARNIYSRSGKSIQKIMVKINQNVRELTYFNQPFLVKTLRTGVKISLAGNEYEVNGPLIHTGRLVPIYPETKGKSSKWFRRQIYNTLKKPIVDWLPLTILKKYSLINLNQALQQIHFPANQSQIDQAKKRLAFDEMLKLQLISRQHRLSWTKPTAMAFRNQPNQLQQIIQSLPYKLTPSQVQAIQEITADLTTPKPMNRLLQGEVGSGKTAVAAVAMYLSYLNGQPAALLAPTEILVEQHYQTLKTVFSGTPVTVGRVTKSYKESGDILVGTQALLNQKLTRLGLVVIDEQHRFGVRQRSQLLTLHPRPHLLSMTATPIPRTLALTVYSHLDLSTLNDLPGKQIVKTWLVPQDKRLQAYDWIKQQINQKQSQVFIVCPLINPSEKESMQDIKDITSEYQALLAIFPNHHLGLIHGRLKTDEKNRLIAKFTDHQLDILVATPVIEVGIDIPQASIILIENAERFGLAQLHQLRGRVGRRGQTAYCLLFANKNLARLKTLETTHAGIKLAEIDLQLRGEGKITGDEQHGWNQLQLARLDDLALIKATREASEDPDLKIKLISRKISSIAPN